MFFHPCCRWKPQQQGKRGLLPNSTPLPQAQPGVCTGEVCPHVGKNNYRQALAGFVSEQCCNKPEDNLLPRDWSSSRRGSTHKLGSHIALFPAGELGMGTVTIEVPPQMCPQLLIATPAGREGEFTALIRPRELPAPALATDGPWRNFPVFKLIFLPTVMFSVIYLFYFIRHMSSRPAKPITSPGRLEFSLLYIYLFIPSERCLSPFGLLWTFLHHRVQTNIL